MQNPCLECHEVGVDEDKNHPVCKVCPKRIEYAKGSWRNYDVDGHGGKDIHERIEALDVLAKKRFQKAVVKKRFQKTEEGEEEMTRAQEIEVVISDICEDCFTTVESLRSGSRKPEDVKARRKIVKRLISDDFKVPQRKIASLLGVTYAAVNLIVTKTGRGEFEDDEPEEEFKEEPKHKPVTATIGRVIFKIDFTDHKDIYDFLIKESRYRLRTPEDQVIYMLQKERDGAAI